MRWVQEACRGGGGRACRAILGICTNTVSHSMNSFSHGILHVLLVPFTVQETTGNTQKREVTCSESQCLNPVSQTKPAEQTSQMPLQERQGALPERLPRLRVITQSAPVGAHAWVSGLGHMREATDQCFCLELTFPSLSFSLPFPLSTNKYIKSFFKKKRRRKTRVGDGSHALRDS